MTTKYEIHCGSDAPNMTPDEAMDLARQLAAEAFPHGHSVRVEDGCWMMANGEIVTEKTVVITWLCSDSDKSAGLAHARANRLAGSYKHLARQEAVMVTTQEVYSVMV